MSYYVELNNIPCRPPCKRYYDVVVAREETIPLCPCAMARRDQYNRKLSLDDMLRNNPQNVENYKKTNLKKGDCGCGMYNNPEQSQYNQSQTWYDQMSFRKNMNNVNKGV